MEAFDNWYNEKQIRTMDLNDREMGYEEGAEAGWRAALEWAKEQLEVQCDPYAIDRELEEQSTDGEEIQS